MIGKCTNHSRKERCIINHHRGIPETGGDITVIRIIIAGTAYSLQPFSLRHPVKVRILGLGKIQIHPKGYAARLLFQDKCLYRFLELGKIPIPVVATQNSSIASMYAFNRLIYNPFIYIIRSWPDS